jgi:uncharacterized membrane protein
MGDGEDPFKKPKADGPAWIGVLVVGLGWYYLSFAILWQIVNPLIPLYTQSGYLDGGVADAVS